MDSVVASIVMAAITFPISFFVARGCLRGLIRIIDGSRDRDVL